MPIKHHSPWCILFCMNLSSTEPNSYMKPPHHGIMRPNQEIMYSNTYQPQRMMPSTSASPASGSYNQWANPSLHFNPASSNPGSSNGVGMSQVNPVPSLSTTGESGSSLPLLTPVDIQDILDIQGVNQPRQEQLEQSIQHSQQTFLRKETMPAGENIWHTFEDLQQAAGPQNGPTSTGIMGINYTYSDSQGENQIHHSLVAPQTGLHLKQEPQGQSTLALLDSNNSNLFDYSMINYTPTSSSNQEAMRNTAGSVASVSGQNTQNPSFSLSMAPHLETLNWPYSQFDGEWERKAQHCFKLRIIIFVRFESE